MSFILPLRISTLIWYKVFLSPCLCECVGACYVFVCVCVSLGVLLIVCVYSSMRRVTLCVKLGCVCTHL